MNFIDEHRALIALATALLVVIWLMNRLLNWQGRRLLLQRLRALDPAQREQVLARFVPKFQVWLRLELQKPAPAARANPSTPLGTRCLRAKKWFVGHPALLLLALIPGMLVGMVLGFCIDDKWGVSLGGGAGIMLAFIGYANLRVWLQRSMVP